MICNDCDSGHFDVIFNNVPWLTLEYCPFCGSSDISSDDEEADNDGDE